MSCLPSRRVSMAAVTAFTCSRFRYALACRAGMHICFLWPTRLQSGQHTIMEADFIASVPQQEAIRV